MKTFVHIAGPLFSALAVSGIGSGCDRPEKPTPQPPVVTVAKPVQRDTVIYHDFTGTTESIHSVEVRARVKGFLQSVEFEPSSDVKKDDLLFVIDPAEYQATLDEKEAELARSEADLKQAKWDMARFERLAKQQAAQEKEIQDARTSVAQGEAAVKSARAAVDQARLKLGYTQVRSPISGRVGRNLVDVGNLVGANENTLLTTVMQMDPMYVYFNAPERILLVLLARRQPDERRKLDAKFYVGLVHEKGHPHEGVLDYIDNTVDPSTGTIRVRGVLPNKQGLLFPGAFVRVRVPRDDKADKTATLVRERAVGTDLGGKYVLVVDDKNIVDLRHVQIGALDEQMRVIEDGLAPDERYIVNGMQRARPGLPVNPKTEEELPSKPRQGPDKNAVTRPATQPATQASAD